MANFPGEDTVQFGEPRRAPVALVNARKPRLPCESILHACIRGSWSALNIQFQNEAGCEPNAVKLKARTRSA